MPLDPYLERESTHYEHPLPSRELVLQLLAEQGVPLARRGIVRQVARYDPAEAEIFARRLRAMERDGQIMRNRKNAICLVERLDLIKGTVTGHQDGFGFLVPDDGSPDLVLSGKQMDKVLHGDRVMARDRGGPARAAGGQYRRGAGARQRAPGRAAVRGARHPLRDRGEQAHQPGNPGRARLRPGRSPARW